MIKISGAKIVSGEILEKNVYIKDKKIYKITSEELPFDTLIDGRGLYLSAGFIDTHLHGGGGGDFMDDDEEMIRLASKTHLAHGSTSIFPTTVTASPDKTVEAIERIRRVASDGEHNISGIFLEGPYFSKNQAGAQDGRYITPPIKADYERIIASGEGFIKKVGFAPELEGAMEFMKFLQKNNIIPAAAHTDADFEKIKEFHREGLNLLVHFYSSMSTIVRKNAYRVLGAVEAGYLFDEMFVEVIADGRHLPPDLLKLIYKVKGDERIMLVTDAMRAAGEDTCESVLGDRVTGLRCIIEDGVAKLPDRTSFAGSVATADRLVRTMVKEALVPLPSAIKMMTETPARFYNLANKGKVEEGFDADLVLFDGDINIKSVILQGKKVI